MKKIMILSTLIIVGGWAAKAQSTGAAPQTTDTTHRHGMRHDWSHQGQPTWRDRQNRGQDGRDGDMGRRQDFGHGTGRHRGGFGEHTPLRYTADQRKQLMAINMDFRHKQEDLYKQDNLTLGAYKAQLLGLQKDKRTKEKGILTADQQTEIAHSRQWASEDQKVMAAARLERMTLHLQLTDDQAAKIKTQEADFMSHVQSIRNNDDLLPDQKREQMKSLFTQHQEAIASVLTPDQLAKYKDMRHPGGPGGRSGWHQGRQQD